MKFQLSPSLAFLVAAAFDNVAEALEGYGPLPSEASVGDEICVYGFIMDNWCIVDTGGFLLDNPSVTTLLNPEMHSFHCLLDVGVCNSSPYHVLSPPQDGGTMYGTGWTLSSNDMLLEAGRALGQCSTCGTAGSQQFGFRAAVSGTVESTDPPLLTVESVEGLENGAAGCTMDVGTGGTTDMVTNPPTTSTPAATDPTTSAPSTTVTTTTTSSPTVTTSVATTDTPTTSPSADVPTSTPTTDMDMSNNMTTTSMPTTSPTSTSSGTTATDGTAPAPDAPTDAPAPAPLPASPGTTSYQRGVAFLWFAGAVGALMAISV